MHQVFWLLKWLLKVTIFFTLFAFALNNQMDVTVRFFFGHQWTAPLVLVVLCAFGLGLLMGIFGMVPRWWRQRQSATLAHSKAQAALEAQDKNQEMPPHGL